MHFTLWPSVKATEGGHAEIAWPDFLRFVAEPQIAPAKDALEGWSPVRFDGDRRGKANVEAVSLLVLDDDSSALSTDTIAALWDGYAGVVHTSHSHTLEHPKHRIALRLSRDVTADEHARLWSWAAARHTVDTATRDPSRLWFVPAHRDGAPYEWRELGGAPLDVDSILNATPQTAEKREEAPDAPGTGLPAPPVPGPLLGGFGRRKAMVAALGAAWPPHGERHKAKLALAGALRAEGWSQDEAREVFRALYAAVGSRGDPDAEALNTTFAAPPEARLTGWNSLKAHVDPAVVDAVRGVLSRDAEWSARDAARLVEVTAPVIVPELSEGLGFEFGCWDKEPPQIEFVVDGLIPRGCVGMFFGRADALKTWLLFSLGLAVATGKPWLGRFNVPKALKVGIVDFETGKANVDRRLFMLGAGTTENLGRKSFAKLKPNDPEFWLALAEDDFDLVIIDSLRRANPGANENESGEAIRPLELAAEFSELSRASVLFVHHAKKDSADGWPEFRGSGAIEDQVDVSFAVKKTDVSPELKTIELRCEKPGDMTKPAPFVVEVVFNDVTRKAALRHVEAKAKDKEEETKPPEDNKTRALKILAANPTGVPKQDLLNMLEGANAARRKALSELLIAGLTVEYRAEKKTFVMNNPHAKQSS